jgi:N-acyl-D-amino-acid deacylase
MTRKGATTMASRRAFLATLGAATATACASRYGGGATSRPDVVIRGGLLFDGRGGPAVEGDVAIVGTRVSAVGRVRESGLLEIDARGLAVAPGFIDIHSHADGTLFDDPNLESIIRQGVTTVVVGQDGSSRAPHEKGGDPDERGRETFALLFDDIQRLPPAANIASMVGLGTVRAAVVGEDDRPATSEEIARMRALVDRALADGACGVSTGLEYTPGAFASLAELVEVTRPAAAHGVVYSTHMRNEDDRLLEAIDESIAVAEGAKCGLQVAHLKAQGPRNWGKLDAVFERFAAARGRGVDVAFDVYPYVAYQTGLTNLFPVWSRDGGTEAFLARLRDAALADRIRREAEEKAALIGGWQNVQISSVSAAEDRRAEGARLEQAARAAGREPYAYAVELLLRNRASVGMIGFAMSEPNVERELAHPIAMVCSDGGAFAAEGPARRGRPHPRGLGTFPRVLGRYVRERKVMPLAEAIRKMTAAPAERCRLEDRGTLRPGAFADVTAFDPAAIADRATFDDPFQYPVGVHVVIVNGVVALREGTRGPRSGVALHSGA